MVGNEKHIVKKKHVGKGKYMAGNGNILKKMLEKEKNKRLLHYYIKKPASTYSGRCLDMSLNKCVNKN